MQHLLCCTSSFQGYFQSHTDWLTVRRLRQNYSSYSVQTTTLPPFHCGCNHWSTSDIIAITLIIIIPELPDSITPCPPALQPLSATVHIHTERKETPVKPPQPDKGNPLSCLCTPRRLPALTRSLAEASISLERIKASRWMDVDPAVFVHWAFTLRSNRLIKGYTLYLLCISMTGDAGIAFPDVQQNKKNQWQSWKEVGIHRQVRAETSSAAFKCMPVDITATKWRKAN